MKVEVSENSGGVAVVKVLGEVDMMTAPDVRDVLLPFFEASMRGVVVDLSGVSYMDSSGIATMIEGLQWSTRENKKFIIAGISEAVMDVFVLTNLKDVFEFSPDSQSAMSAITGG